MPLIVKDPRGVLTSAPERVRDAAHLERRRRAAAADDRQRARTTGAREAHYSHLADRADLAGDPRRPQRRRVAPTCCTRPTRP